MKEQIKPKLSKKKLRMIELFTDQLVRLMLEQAGLIKSQINLKEELPINKVRKYNLWKTQTKNNL